MMASSAAMHAAHAPAPAMTMERYWDHVHATAHPEFFSWYEAHAERSLALLEAATTHDGRVIDVGGGASTLVDDLLERGWTNLHVLDISAEALDLSRRRLGASAQRVTWLQADITRVALPQAAYDVWHDRGMFHFLGDPDSRATYVAQVRHAVRPGGHVIVAVFGPGGPRYCGGLQVARFSAQALRAEFGAGFELVGQVEEPHRTPRGATQPLVVCHWVMH